MAQTQSFSNHAKRTPFYLLAALVLVVNLGWGVYRLIQHLDWDHAINVLLALALASVWFHARVFALTVQNRVIRLEMRLRLQALLPADLQPRIPELTLQQLIALRFASDSELPALTRKVLADGIKDQKTIKQMIVNWEADYLRA